jgi:excisionase family DNA binding protein
MNTNDTECNGSKTDPEQAKNERTKRAPNPRFRLTPEQAFDIRRNPPLLMTVPETAALLAMSDRSVWARIRDGEIPARNIGGRVLIRLKDLKV